MTLPAFNAEQSLYKTSVHYRSMSGATGDMGVALQQLNCQPCLSFRGGPCVRICSSCGPIGCLEFTERCGPVCMDFCDYLKQNCINNSNGFPEPCTPPMYPLGCATPGCGPCCFKCE